MSVETGDRPALAIALLVGGMLVMSFVDNLVRVFSDDLSVWQFHLLRAAFALPMLGAAAMMLRGETIRPRRLWWVILRGVLIAISMLLFFASIPMLPMAQCTAGLFTAPLFVVTISALFLNEPVGPRRIVAVAAGFLGAMLIVQPFGQSVTAFAVMPVVAGFFYALSVLITRQKCREESPVALLFANFTAFGLMGICGAAALTAFPPSETLHAAAPFLFSTWQTPPGWAVLGMAGMALGAVIGIAGLTRAYQLADSSFLTLFDYTHLIGATFFAWVLWSEIPPMESAVGIALIVGAGAYIALRSRPAVPAANPQRGMV